MKVVLGEKRSLKKENFITYGIIVTICVVSIIVVFYEQFLKDRVTYKQTEIGQKSQVQIEMIKAEFDEIFKNDIEENEETNSYNVKDNSKKVVYTSIEKNEETNNYNMNIHIPQINIDNEIIDKYNEQINQNFVRKAESIQKEADKNIIYTVDYVANIQDGILSLIIRSNLKEDSDAQRIIIKTYNYDLKNNREISLEDVLKTKGLDKNLVQSQINKEIEEKKNQAEDLKKLGYNIYMRDTSSNIYEVKNTKEFYLTKNAIYIIYAYGNTRNTSEVDIIVL